MRNKNPAIEPPSAAIHPSIIHYLYLPVPAASSGTDDIFFPFQRFLSLNYQYRPLGLIPTQIPDCRLHIPRPVCTRSSFHVS